jgi:hypothetical protein
MQKKQWRAGTSSQGVNRRPSRCYVFDCETLKCHSNTSRLFRPRSGRSLLEWLTKTIDGMLPPRADDLTSVVRWEDTHLLMSFCLEACGLASSRPARRFRGTEKACCADHCKTGGGKTSGCFQLPPHGPCTGPASDRRLSPAAFRSGPIVPPSSFGLVGQGDLSQYSD